MRKPGPEKLIRKVMETLLAHYDERVPARGSFQAFSVTFQWPGTNYQGLLRVEPSLSGPAQERCLRTMMHQYGSDRAVSHYVLWGDNLCLKQWLADKEKAKELLESYRELKESVDDFD